MENVDGRWKEMKMSLSKIKGFRLQKKHCLMISIIGIFAIPAYLTMYLYLSQFEFLDADQIDIRLWSSIGFACILGFGNIGLRLLKKVPFPETKP